MLGSQPTELYDTSLANGFRLCSLQASSVAITTADAPSQTPYKLKKNISLYSLYYAEACSGFAGPYPRHCARAKQLL